MYQKYSDEELLEGLREFHEETDSVNRVEYQKFSGGACYQTLRDRFGSWGNAIDAAGLPHDFPMCPTCRNFYPKLGSHWRYNRDHQPELSDRQLEIVIGLMLGDGSRIKSDSNPAIQSCMTNLKFLSWVDDEMGIFSRGIVEGLPKEERAKINCESGFSPTANPDNYEDIFHWKSRQIPEFQRFSDWYVGPRTKEFPDDLELTPLTLKIWFVCDGNLSVDDRSEGTRPFARIANRSQMHQKNLISEKFDDIGLNPSFNSCYIQFGADDTEKFFEYIGGPLPGFSDKWSEGQ